MGEGEFAPYKSVRCKFVRLMSWKRTISQKENKMEYLTIRKRGDEITFKTRTYLDILDLAGVTCEEEESYECSLYRALVALNDHEAVFKAYEWNHRGQVAFVKEATSHGESVRRAALRFLAQEIRRAG